jgi:hypothetical protein
MNLYKILIIMFSFFCSNSISQNSLTSFYDLEIKSIEGKEIDFKTFKGKKSFNCECSFILWFYWAI